MNYFKQDTFFSQTDISRPKNRVNLTRKIVFVNYFSLKIDLNFFSTSWVLSFCLDLLRVSKYLLSINNKRERSAFPESV